MKLALLALCAAMAASAHAAATDVAPLFERAAKVYGQAQTLSLDYRVFCDAPAWQMEERGHISWKPGFYAQDFIYARGHGHFAAQTNAKNAGTIYFTRTGGQSGRLPWQSDFGFWASLPWDVPGHVEALLRGRRLGAGAAQVLPAQKVDGVWCDGVAVDTGAGQDKFRFWFARRDGTLRRESWRVVLPDGGKAFWVQTSYSAIRVNAPLERTDFVAPAEENAPLVDPDSFADN